MPRVITVPNVALAGLIGHNLPSDAGVALPANLRAHDIAVDLGGSIPPGQHFTIAIDQMVGGVWSWWARARMTTGPLVDNPASTINHLTLPIRPSHNGQPIGTYPTRVRLRVEEGGATWVLPSVSLDVT